MLEETGASHTFCVLFRLAWWWLPRAPLLGVGAAVYMLLPNGVDIQLRVRDGVEIQFIL
jgi:hypothetical protein